MQKGSDQEGVGLTQGDDAFPFPPKRVRLNDGSAAPRQNEGYSHDASNNCASRVREAHQTATQTIQLQEEASTSSIATLQSVASATSQLLRADGTLRQGMWLDKIPVDVRERIAIFLIRFDEFNRGYGRGRSGHVVSLAESSVSQAEAVQLALRHTLALPVYTCKHRYRLIAALPEIKHAQCIEVCSYDARLFALFTRPSLTSVSISNRPQHLRALTKAPFLSELTLEMEHGSRPRFEALIDALKAFKSLRTLTLQCSKWDFDGKCIYKDWRADAFREISSHCPDLTHLKINCACNCYGWQSSLPDLGWLPGAFPKLRRLSTTRPLPDSATPYLQTLQSVEAIGWRDPLERASEIGDPVIAILNCDPCWHGGFWPHRHRQLTCMRLLAKCTRLQRLALFLEPGYEHSFPDTLYGLIMLELHWLSERRDFSDVASLHCLDSGWLTRLVHTSKCLREIKLYGVRIGLEELLLLMQSIGSNLRVLGTTIAGQAEGPAERLIRLVDCILRHNRSLESLYGRSQDRGEARLLLSACHRAYEGQCFRRVELSEQVFWRLKRVHLCVPTLNMRTLWDSVLEMLDYLKPWLRSPRGCGYRPGRDPMVF